MLHGNANARRTDLLDATPVPRMSGNVLNPRLPNMDMPPRASQHGLLFVPPHSSGFVLPPRCLSSPRKPPMLSDGPAQKLNPRPVLPAEGRPVMLRGGGPQKQDELAVQDTVDGQPFDAAFSGAAANCLPWRRRTALLSALGAFVTSFVRGAPVSRRRDQGPRYLLRRVRICEVL